MFKTNTSGHHRLEDDEDDHHHIISTMDQVEHNQNSVSVDFQNEDDTTSFQTAMSPEEEVDIEETNNFTSQQTEPKPKKSARDILKSAIPTVNKSQLLWLLKLARPEILLIILGTIGLLFSSIINIVIPVFIGDLIDRVTTAEFGSFNSTILILIGLIVVTAVAGFVRTFCFTLAGERVVARLRKLLFDSIIVQEIGYFDSNKTGELLNRLSSDTKSLENAVTINISMTLRFTVQIIGATVMLFWISWKLCLLMLAVIPFMVFGAFAYGRFVKKLSKSFQDALAKASDVAEESISNVRTVRAFANEQKHKEFYSKSIDESFALARKLAIASGTFFSLMQSIALCSMVGVIWLGGYLVSIGELTIGTLTTFLINTLFVAFALGGLSSLYFDILRALGATERVHEIVSRKPELSIENNHGDSPDIKGHIVFENVNFSYPTRPDTVVLNNLNLEIKQGSVVALVGESGGGKSTIASLILRFYDPTSGAIYLDGKNLKDFDPNYLRRNIGSVSQEPVLFATSIRDNIKYAKPYASDDEIVEVAKKANAHNFIRQFKEKYGTLCGERGIRLSGGQKQRVSIARAMLQEPPILILDEATSALDSKSELLVQQGLERLMQGRTVIIIAHRLSTVKNADLVCVVKKGSIVEMGKHEELLGKDTFYKNLVENQLLSNQETMQLLSKNKQ